MSCTRRGRPAVGLPGPIPPQVGGYQMVSEPLSVLVDSPAPRSLRSTRRARSLLSFGRVRRFSRLDKARFFGELALQLFDRGQVGDILGGEELLVLMQDGVAGNGFVLLGA